MPKLQRRSEPYCNETVTLWSPKTVCYTIMWSNLEGTPPTMDTRHQLLFLRLCEHLDCAVQATVLHDDVLISHSLVVNQWLTLKCWRHWVEPGFFSCCLHASKFKNTWLYLSLLPPKLIPWVLLLWQPALHLCKEKLQARIRKWVQWHGDYGKFFCTPCQMNMHLQRVLPIKNEAISLLKTLWLKWSYYIRSCTDTDPLFDRKLLWWSDSLVFQSSLSFHLW